MENPFRVDWPHIRDTMAAIAGSDKYLLVVPHAGRHLLLSLIERLTWEATYRVPGYGYEDYDDLQALVAETEYGLQRGTRMDDLIAALNAIRDALGGMSTVINNTNNNPCCGALDDYVATESDVVVGVGDVPAAVADRVEDWDEYKAYLCDAAHTWMDALLEHVQQYKTLINAGLLTMGAVLAITALLAPLGIAIIASLGAVASLYAALIRVVDATLIDELLLQLQEDKERIICLVTGSSTAAEAYAKYLDYSNSLNEIERLIIRYSASQNTFNALFNGEHAGVAIRLRYSGALCAPCEDEPVLYELDQTYTFPEDDPQGWVAVQNAHLGTDAFNMTPVTQDAIISMNRSVYMAQHGLPAGTRHRILVVTYQAQNTHATRGVETFVRRRRPAANCGASGNEQTPAVTVPPGETVDFAYNFEPLGCRGTDTINSLVSIHARRLPGSGSPLVRIMNVRVAGEVCEC